MEEYWDIYDKNRRLTGHTLPRGPLPAGCYNLVVQAIVRNSAGLILLTKRHPDKPLYPNLWECTAGAAVAGESSLDGVIRELREETGITADPREAIPLLTQSYSTWFKDTWLFLREVDLRNIILQEGETVDARLASYAEFMELCERGEAFPLLSEGIRAACLYGRNIPASEFSGHECPENPPGGRNQNG